MPMPDEPNLILLDTHIWLWLESGVPQAVSPKLRALIEKLTPASAIRVSAISAWEIGILVAKNRIAFTIGLREWINRAMGAPGIQMEPVDTEIAMESTKLPGQLHGDPADRILLATAKKIGATFITHDKEILSYCKKQGLSALSL